MVVVGGHSERGRLADVEVLALNSDGPDIAKRCRDISDLPLGLYGTVAQAGFRNPGKCGCPRQRRDCWCLDSSNGNCEAVMEKEQKI